MEIAKVRGYALSSPINPVQSREFHGGVRRLLKRDIVLVVIETKDGEQGFAPGGASSSAMREYFEDESQMLFSDLVNEEIAPALEGTSIQEVEDAHDIIDNTDLPERVCHEAASAVDVALYDLKGKRTGTPIYELLSDRFDTEPTTSLPMYASAGMYMPPEGYEEQARILDELGFFGYKYRPGIGPEKDRHTIDILNEVTEDIEIMLDAHTWWKMGNHSYGSSTISDLVEYAGSTGAYWIEEPVEPDDHDGYRELSELGASLAGGESKESPQDLIELAQTGAVDFLQGDVRHHRGFTGCSTIIEFCQGKNIEFVPHNFGTWLGLVANAHLVSAAPEVNLLEYPVFENDPALESSKDPGMYPFELAFDIIEEDLEVSNGHIEVPDGPGLGVTVDLDIVEDYPATEGPWTEFHYKDE
ncbi:mandelate racemase/muconate lactonizing enzyme family protein [Halalkalicoccus tibetensis]|uniref:Mandelate racemase/muconate lactonizing enzyme family protein n=1 Tax=Halalkalicoccus tibetensis TaxID=175632 RepID=A0ABD5V7B0_9EURY